jgi:alpha-L-fucosidase
MKNPDKIIEIKKAPEHYPAAMVYDPILESVKKHPVPQWFHNAKFGIFIHWTIASVPAFAPVDKRDIVEIVQQDGWETQYKNNPYVEWYLNSLRIPGSPVSAYHEEKYGKNYSYDNFAPEFNRCLTGWDPEKWAEIFKAVGARYVVLVAKHHDGFLLWPSKQPNPLKKNWHASRDIVGELTRAVRSKGIKMGLYYSGALDWSFNPAPITDVASFIVNGPTEKRYADYVDAHYRELIDAYAPDILWNDIGYPPKTNLYALFSYYYNKIPDGLVNDRWIQIPEKRRRLYTSWPIRPLLNWVIKRATIKHGIKPPPPPHSDYATPEYTTLSAVSKRKWECVRGIGKSFGYNQAEEADDYLSSDGLIRMLVDIVSKNGNFLLNVGPMSNGKIPEIQLDRIIKIGNWLRANGEAVYDTRPWTKAQGKTACGIDIRYTRNRDRLFAMLLNTPQGPDIVIQDLHINNRASITLLGSPGDLKWRQDGPDLRVVMPPVPIQQPVYSLMISPF